MANDDDRQLDVLYISPEAFRRSPQVGVPCVMPWRSFALYLSRPIADEDKGAVGGYALGRYAGNARRKSGLDAIGAASLDFDQSAADVVSVALARYAAIVHETFSSTADAPRCRAIVLLSEPVNVATYDELHTFVRARLCAAGLPPDEGAKDASRLSYSPVRRPGAGFAFRVSEGAPLDARAIIAAQPPAPPRSAPRLVAPEHADRYLSGALRRAANAVASGNPGERHYTLSKEAFGLARLGIAEHDIVSALLPAFVAAAGEARRREGERTIADAIRARRGAA